MIFIGSGSLLTHSVNYAIEIGANIDAVCIPIGDSSISRLKKSNIYVIESNNPNIDVVSILNRLSDGKIFSINNKFILDDSLLKLGPTFFNIHNGLVQHYRGIGEVCIFAAICNDEAKYGVTLQQLIPGQKVDSGPVVDQIKFTLSANDEFYEVMKKSLAACMDIFELNILRIINNSYKLKKYKLFGAAYTYKDVARICEKTEPNNLRRAISFGPYKGFLTKLVDAFDSARIIKE